jgi:hypothetical protein
LYDDGDKEFQVAEELVRLPEKKQALSQSQDDSSSSSETAEQQRIINS